MLVCHCGNDVDKMIHEPKYGDGINFRDLSDEHLENIIARINRLAETGITLGDGDIGSYEEEFLTGSDLRKRFHYCCYVTLQEARRGKILVKNRFEDSVLYRAVINRVREPAQ